MTSPTCRKCGCVLWAPDAVSSGDCGHHENQPTASAPCWQVVAVFVAVFVAVLLAVLLAASGMYYAVCGKTPIQIVAGAAVLLVSMFAAVLISESRP